MIKSFKIRIYPNKEQERLMWKHIGCCRYIWNYMIAYQEELYEAGEKHLSRFDMTKHLTTLKNDGEHEWLYEVANASLQVVCADLAESYNGFFKKRKRFPKYKSKKKSKPSFPLRADGLYFTDDGVKVRKLGVVKYKSDFNFPKDKGQKFRNPRISFINGKWMLSFGIECENQTPILTDNLMGIDLGVKDLAIVAYAEDKIVFHNINKSSKMRDLNKQLIHIHRNISRKYESVKKKTGKYEKTNNIIKEEEKLRKLYAKITNIRVNYIHQVTHELISLFPKRVVMEDLNIAGMLRNRHLSKVIREQCLGEFIRQMQYKCEWNGIEFIQADRFYPSSKTCSACGHIKEDLKLSDRTYICPECGMIIDRDYNAAINLMKYMA